MTYLPDSDIFNLQIQDAQERFEQLKQRSQQFPWAQNDMAAESLEELSTALEELHVAAEEMRYQHESIMEAQETILAERQRYLDLFEFAPDAYVVTDLAGHIQEANQAAVTLLGLSRNHLVSKMLVMFVPLEHRKAFRSKLTQIQQTLQPIQNWECQIVKPRGVTTPCEISASPLAHAHQEQFTELRWLIRDVTEQKRILEMETASRIKDEFLAIVSHELRSPLNPILGWSNLLRHGSLDEEKTAYALETIERNAKLQVQLVEDLLDVSRILRSKVKLEPAPVDLVTTIEAAIETVRLAAEAKGVEIRFFQYTPTAQPTSAGSNGYSSDTAQTLTINDLSPPASLQTWGDAARLQQVMWNLLSNAVKFTPAGGHVEVKVERVPKNKKKDIEKLQASALPTSRLSPALDYAKITVTDTGKGIQAEFLPYVFEYFRQADSTTTRKFGGLGLGLAIVDHLVELHGGTVQANSLGEDQGATFTVRLPLLKAQQAALVDNEHLPAAANPPPVSPPLEGVQVLLVDDDVDTNEIFTFTLEQSGANVTATQSVDAALKALEEKEYDVLVSDIAMPEKDGYTLLRQLHALFPQSGKKISAIALTAHAGELNQRTALAAGFQLHISKPVEPAELVSAIAQLIESRLSGQP